MAQTTVKKSGEFEITYWIGNGMNCFAEKIPFSVGDSPEDIRAKVEAAVSAAFTKMAKDNDIPSFAACDELWVPPNDC